MDQVREYKPMTVFDFCTFLERFISDGSRSRSVEDRWLAGEAAALLPLAREVRNNNIGPDIRAKINQFRAEELEVEIEEKRQAVELLERDLKKVRAA